MANNNKLINAIIIVFMFTNLIGLVSIIAYNLDATKARHVATQQRTELKKQNDYIICVLGIQPQDRTPAVIDKCKSITIGE